MKTFKRILSSLMVAVMVLTCAPLSGFVGLELPNVFNIFASAESYSGTCGDNLTWSFDDETGELDIAGKGAMYDYNLYNSPWESYSEEIKIVTIGNGVTEISIAPFYNCGEIKELTMPISANIYDNSGTIIKSINVEKLILTKGDVTAQNYSGSAYIPWYINEENLKQIIIGVGITSIKNSAFADCTELVSVTIPNSVTTIGKRAFQDCDSLASVTIPDSVTSIGEYAFVGCTGLTRVTIGDGVTSVGDSTFAGCTELASVTIPNSVTSIGVSAFAGCTELARITIPDSVTSIGRYAFYNTGYYNNDYNWEDDVLYISNHIVEAREYITGMLTVKSGTKTISDYAFYYCSGLRSITIPDSVTNIGEYAFYYCSGLRSITIPDSVTRIGDYTFYRCTRLARVTIPDSVTSIGNYAFYECSGIKELIMPISAEIYNSSYTFYNCTNIEKITLTKGNGTVSRTDYKYTPWYISRVDNKQIVFGEGISKLDESLLYRCTGHPTITIPASVTYIDAIVFYECYGLSGIMVSESNPVYSSDEYGVLFNKDKTTLIKYPIGNKASNYNIPDSVECIGENAFEYSDNLTSVTIPDSVTVISDNAFSFNYGLRSVFIPDSVQYIGQYAFADCDNLDIVEISGGNTTIGDYAFAFDENLNYLTLGEGVVCINEGAFFLCGLVSVKIPDSVTTIGYEAFSSCYWLENLVIGKGVTTIDQGAFSYCDRLKSVIIPENVTTIGTEAFSYSSLETVIIYGKNLTIEAYAFCDCVNLTNLILGEGIVCIQEGAFDGSNVTDVCYLGTQEQWETIEIDENNECFEYSSIYFEEDTDFGWWEYNMFWDYYPNGTLIITGAGEMPDYDDDDRPWQDYIEEIRVVVIGNEVNNIGSKAFSECENLTDVIIGDGVTTIGEYAFYQCANLKNVVMGNNVNTIEPYAFYYCRRFKSLTIPESVTTVSSDAFQRVVFDNVYFDGTLEQMNMIDGNLPSETHYKHMHNFEWVVTREPTLNSYGEKEGTCSICSGCNLYFSYRSFALPEIDLLSENTVNLDYSSNFVSGLIAGLTSLDSYIVATNSEYNFVCDDKVIGTGSVIKLTDNETVISEFTAVIFGDVNSDSWYDGQDAIIVDCLANGMLTKDDVSEAVYMAADCNHDGVVDQLDVDLLNQAGALLANVDQSKPTEVLLETSSEYVEYISLIDQSFEIDVEDEEDSTTPDTEENVEETEPSQANFFSFILDFVEFFKQIFNFILEFINN